MGSRHAPRSRSGGVRRGFWLLTAFSLAIGAVVAASAAWQEPAHAQNVDARCVEQVALTAGRGVSRSGRWASGCESSLDRRGYARWYTFELAERTEVHLAASSSDTVVDPDFGRVAKFTPVLYLRSGEATGGGYMAESENSNATDVYRVLGPGTYTVEATNLDYGVAGRFRLSIDTRTLEDFGRRDGFGPDPSIGNNSPRDIHSDGTTMWRLNFYGEANTEDEQSIGLFAHKMSDGTRDRSKETISPELIKETTGNDPNNLWIDNGIVWILGDGAVIRDPNDLVPVLGGEPGEMIGRFLYVERKLYPFNLSTGALIEDRTINVSSVIAAQQHDIFEFFIDGPTAYVATNHLDSFGRSVCGSPNVFAFDLSDGSRDSTRDFTLSGAPPGRGIHTDGNTIWMINARTVCVGSHDVNQITAYRFSDGSRDAAPSTVVYAELNGSKYMVGLNTQPVRDPTLVNAESWNAGWDQGFAARQWYETEKKVKERWEEEHRDLTPKQRSELEALQQADLDIYRAITAEARKTRERMERLLSEVGAEIADGKWSADWFLQEGRQVVADSVKSAGFNLLPCVEELQSCDPTATYVQVLPGGVGIDGSNATVSVGIGHLEIDSGMPEWDPASDPAVGVSLNINDFFKRDSYMSLVLQKDGSWQIPEFGLILRSGEEDALGLLG